MKGQLLHSTDICASNTPHVEFPSSGQLCQYLTHKTLFGHHGGSVAVPSSKIILPSITGGMSIIPQAAKQPRMWRIGFHYRPEMGPGCPRC